MTKYADLTFHQDDEFDDFEKVTDTFYPGTVEWIDAAFTWLMQYAADDPEVSEAPGYGTLDYVYDVVGLTRNFQISYNRPHGYVGLTELIEE